MGTEKKNLDWETHLSGFIKAKHIDIKCVYHESILINSVRIE